MISSDVLILEYITIEVDTQRLPSGPLNNDWEIEQKRNAMRNNFKENTGDCSLYAIFTKSSTFLI